VTDRTVKITMSKAIGAMLGAASGDALGWPNERPLSGVRSKEQESLFEFKGWKRRSGGRYYPHEEFIEAGSYSDDTQLILCIARSLQYGIHWWNRFCHVELPFWGLYERGGGGATKRAVDAWLDGISPWSDRRAANDVRRYFEAGGNGVAMRVLPHILFHADSPEFSFVARNIMLDGIATHGHPRALVGALAYGYALWKSIRRTTQLGFGEIIEDLFQNVSEWELIPELSAEAQNWIVAANNYLPGYRDLWKSVVQEMLDLLTICRQELKKGALTIDEDALRALQCFDGKMNGAGTVAAGAAVFLASRYAPEASHGLTTAAFAIGSDTDTIASMTGALLGTFNGVDWLKDLQNAVQDSEYLKKVAIDLVSHRDHIAHSEFQNNIRPRLNKWNEALSELNPGAICELPDGRKGSIISRNERIGKSGKFKVTFLKMVSSDGQSLYFSKIKKGSFLPKELPKETAAASRLKVIKCGPKLPVQSFDDAIRFYENVVGLNVKKRKQNFVVFEQGIVLVTGDYPKTEYDGNCAKAIIYIELSDIEKCYEIVKSGGFKIISPLSLWANSKRSYFRCTDPDGNIVEIFSAE